MALSKTSSPLRRLHFRILSLRTEANVTTTHAEVRQDSSANDEDFA